MKMLRRSGHIDLLIILDDAEDAPFEATGLEKKEMEAVRNLLREHADNGTDAPRDRLYPTGIDRIPAVLIIRARKGRHLTLHDLTCRLGRAVETARSLRAASVCLAGSCAIDRLAPDARVAVILRIFRNAFYRFDRFRKKSVSHPRLYWARPAVLGASEGRSLLDGVERLGAGIDFYRELADSPPNEIYPETFAAAVADEAEKSGWEVEIWEVEKLRTERMTGLVTVGAGAGHPPRMVRITFNPNGERRIVLAGKGITFDSGGLSLKSPASMTDMKYDKCGAALMAGLVPVVPTIVERCRVDILLPLAENIPGPGSARPGDIVTFRDGTHVEVVNTDAEGRLVLADALILAKESGADLVIDAATLTGACSVALGRHAAGLFGTDERIIDCIGNFAAETGDWVWPMPLWPEYDQALKGNHADVKNAAGRYGSAITAAHFLRRFIDPVPWCHLDIAGAGYTAHNGGAPRGANGWGVALMARAVEAFDRETL